MRVGAVVTDLMLFSRLDSAATGAGATLLRVDDPAQLPDDLDLVLVDWAAREPAWTGTLRAMAPGRIRVVLFGPHTDLDAHAAARASGMGPMMARSKLLASLPSLLGTAT